MSENASDAGGGPSSPPMAPLPPAASRTRPDEVSQNEAILALLRQERLQREENIARATAALSGTLPSSLAPPSAITLPPFSVAVPSAATSLEIYLAAAAERQQRQLLSGLSASTYLELAQYRPDLLAHLGLPPPLGHSSTIPSVSASGSTSRQTLEAASALASLVPAKRPRPDENEAAREDGEKHSDAEPHAESTTKVAASPAAIPRPRKRAMFHLGDIGDASVEGIGSDGDKDEGEPWTTFMHRSFVQAVFATGIRHASPSVLLDLMSNADNFPLTSERVKSRLQKYRNNSDKSLADFMQEYDSFLQRALSIGSSQSSGATTHLLPFDKVLQIMRTEEPLMGGDAAAAVSYELLYQRFQQNSGAESGGATSASKGEFESTVHRMLTPAALKTSSAVLAENCQGQKVALPCLTEDEKASALGASFEHIKGAFVALVAELKRQRGEAVAETGNAPEEDSKAEVEGDGKPKALESPQLGGTKAVHSKDGEESIDGGSNASGEKKRDEIEEVVALMYQHEKNRKDSSSA